MRGKYNIIILKSIKDIDSKDLVATTTMADSIGIPEPMVLIIRLHIKDEVCI